MMTIKQKKMTLRQKLDVYEQMESDLHEVFEYLDTDDSERLQMILDILCEVETELQFDRNEE